MLKSFPQAHMCMYTCQHEQYICIQTNIYINAYIHACIGIYTCVCIHEASSKLVSGQLRRCLWAPTKQDSTNPLVLQLLLALALDLSDAPLPVRSCMLQPGTSSPCRAGRTCGTASCRNCERSTPLARRPSSLRMDRPPKSTHKRQLPTDKSSSPKQGSCNCMRC